MASTEPGNRRFDDDTHRTTGDRWDRGSGWSESARQVWLAGVGAWTRAQAEGSRLFDGLVRDGLDAERSGARSGDVREAAERSVEDARTFASGAWDRMGQFVEDSVQRAMLRLGVPRREDLDALGRRIDALSAELRDARAAAATAGTAPARKRTTATPAKPTTTPKDPGAATRKPPA